MKPNLFIIGAPKAGTTTLARALGEHPEIFLPDTKEPRFFDARTFYDFEEDHPHASLDSYLALYEGAKPGARYWADASVFNMYSMESIRDIQAFSPDARFIIVVRDPLDASKSLFRQRMKTLYRHLREIDDDFYVCWDALAERRQGKAFPKGCRNSILFRYDLLYRYELYLPQLTQALGDRLLVTSFEAFRADPAAFYSEIFDFLGVEHVSPPDIHLNDSRVVQRTRAARLLYGLANATMGLRRRIAPRARVPAWLRSRLLPQQELKMIANPEKDAEIRAFFASSYACLAALRQNKEQAG